MGCSGIPDDLRALYCAHGQAQVFRFADRGLLRPPEVASLVSQLRSIDPCRVNDIFAQAMHGGGAAHDLTGNGGDHDTATIIEPAEGTVALAAADPADVTAWRKIGLEAVAAGKVAAVVLGGGQGTRLGFDGPKGMYDIGLPSGRSLFQLQAERLRRLRDLAQAEVAEVPESTEASKTAIETAAGMPAGKVGAPPPPGKRTPPTAVPPVPYYVMTSSLNEEQTRRYFAEHDYFGLPADSVFFFPQGTLPCLAEDGQILLESAGRVAEAPDGNGGLYPALAATGALANMKRRGVEYLHVFSVDNALVRPADPVFVGFCVAAGAPCGNKSVGKRDPGERVGVIARRSGRPCVVEYSELPADLCRLRLADGRLAFGAGNICNHFLTRRFLEDVVLPASAGIHHVARKKIRCVVGSEETVGGSDGGGGGGGGRGGGGGKNGGGDSNDCGEVSKDGSSSGVDGSAAAGGGAAPPVSAVADGVKLESFVFDIFPLAERLAVLEVPREDEFAPVKNAPGSAAGDSPDTSRALFGAQARRWAEAAGAMLVYKGSGGGYGASNSDGGSNSDGSGDGGDDGGGDGAVCEISPLVSYAGEGLEARLRGTTLEVPFRIE